LLDVVEENNGTKSTAVKSMLRKITKRDKKETGANNSVRRKGCSQLSISYTARA